MNSLPAIFFISWSPDLPIRGCGYNFLQSLHQQFPQPKAILVISATGILIHQWSALRGNPIIHDFLVPEALYHLSYPAPGAPILLIGSTYHRQVLLCTHPRRGLDHGTWTPLILAYPAADIPVTQLSIQPTVTHSIIGNWGGH